MQKTTMVCDASHNDTTKGKGMDVAEKNPVKYHGVSVKKKKQAPPNN